MQKLTDNPIQFTDNELEFLRKLLIKSWWKFDGLTAYGKIQLHKQLLRIKDKMQNYKHLNSYNLLINCIFAIEDSNY